jgi:ribosomal protein L35
MPKIKSKGAVKKRFRVSKTGKVLCAHPHRGHYKAPMDAKSRRHNRKRVVLSSQFATVIREILGV